MRHLTPDMKRLTISIPEEMDEELQDRVDASTYESKSEAVRELIRRVNEYEQEMNELRAEHEQEIARLEQDVERLRNEKQALIENREYAAQLERYVEDELSYREAGLGTRMKWWLFGKD